MTIRTIYKSINIKNDDNNLLLCKLTIKINNHKKIFNKCFFSIFFFFFVVL